jgi:hypothetical protein
MVCTTSFGRVTFICSYWTYRQLAGQCVSYVSIADQHLSETGVVKVKTVINLEMKFLPGRDLSIFTVFNFSFRAS